MEVLAPRVCLLTPLILRRCRTKAAGEIAGLGRGPDRHNDPLSQQSQRDKRQTLKRSEEEQSDPYWRCRRPSQSCSVSVDTSGASPTPLRNCRTEDTLPSIFVDQAQVTSDKAWIAGNTGFPRIPQLENKHRTLR
jgi:hypothetical protein